MLLLLLLLLLKGFKFTFLVVWELSRVFFAARLLGVKVARKHPNKERTVITHGPVFQRKLPLGTVTKGPNIAY
jgi:hypothetical protein